MAAAAALHHQLAALPTGPERRGAFVDDREWPVRLVDGAHDCGLSISSIRVPSGSRVITPRLPISNVAVVAGNTVPPPASMRRHRSSRSPTRNARCVEPHPVHRPPCVLDHCVRHPVPQQLDADAVALEVHQLDVDRGEVEQVGRSRVGDVESARHLGEPEDVAVEGDRPFQVGHAQADVGEAAAVGVAVSHGVALRTHPVRRGSHHRARRPAARASGSG